jgi:hypothetical protein
VAVSETKIREMLLPRLGPLQCSFAQTEEIFAANVMQVGFTTDNLLVKGWERYSFNYGPSAVFIQLIDRPMSLPLALAAGAAAVVIRNPVVKRRFLWW